MSGDVMFFLLFVLPAAIVTWGGAMFLCAYLFMKAWNMFEDNR